MQKYPAYPTTTKAKLKMTDDEVKMAIAKRATVSDTDALRICYMFNTLQGHTVDHSTDGSKTGTQGKSAMIELSTPTCRP